MLSLTDFQKIVIKNDTLNINNFNQITCTANVYVVINNNKTVQKSELYNNLEHELWGKLYNEYIETFKDTLEDVKKGLVYWDDNRNIPIIHINNHFYALDGWNGEKWFNCWEIEHISNDSGYGMVSDNICISPVYRWEIEENESDSEEMSDDDWEIVGYRLIKL